MPGPINRKKNITGKASEDSVKTQETKRSEGRVGSRDGYADRRAQQANAAQRAVNASPDAQSQQSQQSPARPAHPAGSSLFSRPSQPSGWAAGGSTNTSGSGLGSAPQQQRPQQERPAQHSAPVQAARPQQQTNQNTGSAWQSASAQQSAGTRSGGGMGKIILILLAVLLLGGGGGLSGLFGGGDTTDLPGSATTQTNTASQSNGSSSLGLLDSLLGGETAGNTGTGATDTAATQTGVYNSAALQQLLGGSWYSSQTGLGTAAAPAASSSASALSASANSTAINRSVAAGSRSKYTSILGGGRDTFTLMVYMCGADLESRSAMGTKDLQEMLSAQFGDQVRVIVYTGGSTKWRNNLVSSQANQIWQVKDGQMVCLNSNAGTAAMTDPATLSAFIQYCAQNFRANRYALILWDHGSGSVAGYGYDERNPRSGSMSLAGLDTAFKNGGVKFDFIGFDACLMATLENALMAGKYADYLIASEEAEPGIGWYYTNWLTALGQNPSLSTLDLGKQICDDFVASCARECRGQATTLSVVDLAEAANTVPNALTAFSKSITSLIANKEYKTVSNARNGSREFSPSARIDQVDLTDLCNNLGTQESVSLAKALRGAVKYNRTSISDAYGLSVYFPYQRTANVEKAASTYAAIGMDQDYAEAIRAFAGVEAGGQAVSGGSASPIGSLFGMPQGGGDASDDMIGQLLSAFLGGGGSSFFSDRAMTPENLQTYLTDNRLQADALVFRRSGEAWTLELTPEQWALIHGVDRNVFYDNGSGYVDFGLDNVFSFDEAGRLAADTEATGIAINGQPVAYYHETDEYVSESDWRITGYVPALLNGQRVELLLVFDAANEKGYVAGARAVYVSGETETVAKAGDAPTRGDELVFLADLYDYQQNYIDSYKLGDPIIVGDALTVSDVYLPDASKALITYRFTDLYNQTYWTQPIGR